MLLYDMIYNYFRGRNFRVFRVFQSFSRKFLPLEILNHQNVFPREIMVSFSKIKKEIIKTEQISKVMIYFNFNCSPGANTGKN